MAGWSHLTQVVLSTCGVISKRRGRGISRRISLNRSVSAFASDNIKSVTQNHQGWVQV